MPQLRRLNSYTYGHTGSWSISYYRKCMTHTALINNNIVCDKPSTCTNPMASTTVELNKLSVNNEVADGVETIQKTVTCESLVSSRENSSASWLYWKKILEVISLGCVILVVWGLFALPTIFYALPPLQVSLALYIIMVLCVSWAILQGRFFSYHYIIWIQYSFVDSRYDLYKGVCFESIHIILGWYYKNFNQQLVSVLWYERNSAGTLIRCYASQSVTRYR